MNRLSIYKTIYVSFYGRMAGKNLWVIAIAIISISSLLMFSGCIQEDPDYADSELEMDVLDAEIRETDGYDASPAEGHEFLYIQVELKNPEVEDDLTLNPFDFELLTEEGTEYEYHDHEDRPENVPGGTTSSFWISFEILEEETGDVLRYEPDRLEDDPLEEDIPPY